MLRCLRPCASGLFIALSASLAAASAEPGPANPLQLSAHHATASVADLDKESDWYRRILGFQIVARYEDDPGFKVRQLGIPGYRIDLVWKKGSAPGRQALGAAQQGWLHIVFQTPAIDQAYARLTRLGTDVTADRDTQHAITHLTLHDAEGNEIGIARQ